MADSSGGSILVAEFYNEAIALHQSIQLYQAASLYKKILTVAVENVERCRF
ncbi:MAG: hypothetical protein ACKVG6_11040 [Alphaproteobacteria bacterium]|jgi:hypothetical protein